MSEERKLYPHNKQAYDETMFILNNTNKVAIVQATGTGKGVLAAEFINKAFKGKKVLVLAPTKDILMNYSESLGVSESGVVFKTYSSLSSAYQSSFAGTNTVFKTLSTQADLIILDEFHRTGAEKWGMAVLELIDIASKRGAKTIGLSATPVRYLDSNRDMVDEVFDGHVVQGVTLEEAIIKGILPSFKYIASMYGYSEDILKMEKKLNRLKQEQNWVNTEGLRRAEDALNKLKLQTDEDMVLRETVLKEVRRLEKPQKWIVFCSNKEELEEINEHISVWFDAEVNQFNRTNWEESNEKLNIYSVFSDSGRENLNAANLQGFYRAKKGISIMTCVNKLNEGNHVKGITGIIMLRRTVSPIIYLQQIGRALSAGSKNIPVIFDFINNCDNMARLETDKAFKSLLQTATAVNTYIEQYESQWSNKEDVKLHKIVIKNDAIPITKLFRVLNLLVEPSVKWGPEEIEYLKKFYPKRGAAEVRRKLPKRTEGAIEEEARRLGLKYNPRKREVQVNEDNSLEWLPKEEALVKEYLSNRGNKTRNECAMELHIHMLPHRSPKAILDRYEFIQQGAKSRDTEIPDEDGTPWTKADKHYLVDAYNNNIPAEIIAMTLGRTIKAVRTKARKMGIAEQRGKFRAWTKEEEMFLLRNAEKVDKKILANEMGRTVQALDAKLARLKLEEESARLKNLTPIRPTVHTWAPVEERLLLDNWGIALPQLAMKIPTKNVEQIEAKIKKYCKEYGWKY